MRPISFFHLHQGKNDVESEKQVTANLLEPPEIFEEIDPIDPTLSSLSLTDTKIEKEKEIAKKGRKSRVTFKDTLNCYKKCLQHRSLGIYFFAYATAIIAGTMFMVFQQAHVKDVGIDEPHLLALLTTIGGISEILFRILFGNTFRHIETPNLTIINFFLFFQLSSSSLTPLHPTVSSSARQSF